MPKWWRGSQRDEGETTVSAPGDYRNHEPRQPHSIDTRCYRDSVLCFYFWGGNVKGNYWFV